MSKDLAIRPKGMDILSPAEQGALSAAFRAARRDCRWQMHRGWWKKNETETYRQIVTEFQVNDPLWFHWFNRPA